MNTPLFSPGLVLELTIHILGGPILSVCLFLIVSSGEKSGLRIADPKEVKV